MILKFDQQWYTPKEVGAIIKKSEVSVTKDFRAAGRGDRCGCSARVQETQPSAFANQCGRARTISSREQRSARQLNRRSIIAVFWRGWPGVSITAFHRPLTSKHSAPCVLPASCTPPQNPHSSSPSCSRFDG